MGVPMASVQSRPTARLWRPSNEDACRYCILHNDNGEARATSHPAAREDFSMGECMQTPPGQVTRISCESGNKRKGATTNESAEGSWTVTYWLRSPLVAPTLRGPWISWCWRRASEPDSQGIRRGTLRTTEISEKTLKFRIARGGVGGSTVFAIGGVSSPSALFSADDDGGRDCENVATRPRITKRSVRNVIYPYWRMRQNSFECMDRRESLLGCVL